MKRDEVLTTVLQSADRFGADNPQQFAFLRSRLSRCPSDEVFAGLFAVFVERAPKELRSPRQELAGRLLDTAEATVAFDLVECIRASLPIYDLSVEQLPRYFGRVFGKQAAINALVFIESIDDLNETEAAAARTMRWWLGDPLA
ncbi:hypothetical protein [Variovorax paradoxus]|uniref:hypothetical protein n=1 Tax=Variovorax paradoxus TaxID=34073 RepID=UPI003ECD0AD4